MAQDGAGRGDPFDLAAAAPCGLVRTGAEGVIEAANPRFLHWIGQSEAEVIGLQSFTDLLPAGARVFYEMHLLPRLRMAGELEETAFQIERPNIGRWDVLMSGRVIDTEGTTVLALFPADRRRRYERAQSSRREEAENEANWLRQVETVGGIGAWSFDVDTETLHWSPKVFELFDVPEGNAPSLVDAASYLSSDQIRRDMLHYLARTGRTGEPFSSEVAIDTDEGRRKHLRIKGEAEWRHGRITRVIGVVQDLTRQRQAEAERDQEKARVLQLNANLPAVMMSFERTAEGGLRITYVSPRSEVLWGVSPADLYRDPGILDTMSANAVQAGITEALQQGRDSTLKGRFQMRTPQGETRWFELRGSVAPDHRGGVEGNCVFLDVTPEVEAETELATMASIAQRAQKNEAIGKLTGGVAHDFNNLLAVIMGNLELMGEAISEADRQHCIEQALGAVERGSGLTRSMLAFARQARLEPKVFDLGEVVHQTASWAGRTFPATIAMEVGAAPGLPRVRADPDMAASALLNLLINARDAMPAGGTLRVDVAARQVTGRDASAVLGDMQAGHYVVVSVADTGEGIPGAQVSRIFEPFYTTKPAGSGSGLGLSMVCGFMRQSEGGVRVHSAPGEGSTFELYFPVEAEAPAHEIEPPKKVGTAPFEGCRVLLVEDEAAVLATLGRMIETAGYQVLRARSGDEAVAAFSQGPAIDLLLTDMIMPGKLQGSDLAQALRELRPDLPVIFLTGHASATVMGSEGVRPEDTCLVKPVPRRALLEAIEGVLTRAGVARGGPL